MLGPAVLAAVLVLAMGRVFAEASDILRAECAKVQTGDLLLFEGGEGVAMAYRHDAQRGCKLGCPDESDAELGNVLVLEASASAGGVRLVPLVTRLRDHARVRPGRRCCARLLNVERTPRFLAAIEAAASHKLGMTYNETKYSELVRFPAGLRPTLLSRFGVCCRRCACFCCEPEGGSELSSAEAAQCSGQLFAAEFVAELWMKCSLLQNPLLGAPPASHYTQHHFVAGSSHARQLSRHLHPGVQLGQPQPLTTA